MMEITADHLPLREDLAAKSHGAWECTARKADTYGGYIYTFKILAKYDNVTPEDEATRLKAKEAFAAKQDELYPAIQPLASQLLFLDPTASNDEGKGYSLATRKTFRRLGYGIIRSEDGFSYCLPDGQALSGRWAELKKERPDLPDLDILSVRGKTSHRDFARAYLDHDGLLDSGEECLHDDWAHRQSLLQIILTSVSDYQNRKIRFRELIATYLNRLESAEEAPKARSGQELSPLLDHALGALVDFVGSAGSYQAFGFNASFAPDWISDFMMKGTGPAFGLDIPQFAADHAMSANEVGDLLNRVWRGGEIGKE